MSESTNPFKAFLNIRREEIKGQTARTFPPAGFLIAASSTLSKEHAQEPRQ
jgi:hypothetical protein